MPVERKAKLPRDKISLIHVAKTRLGLSDEDYRAILLRAGGVETSRQLDDFGFNQVMEAFQRLGFRSDFNARHFGHRFDMASPGQVALIRELWKEFTAGTGDEAGFDKWLDKHFKVSSLRFLPAAKAPKVIAACKAMIARRHGDQPKHHS